MIPDEASIVSEIKNHIAKHGGSSFDWYVGISQQPKQLFQERKVDKDNGTWIICEASSPTTAKKVKEIMTSLGMKSGSKEIDEKARFVYVHKMDSH